MDKNELIYIGNLKNGVPVYDRPDSHWQTAHKVVTSELLKEALLKIDTDEDLFLETIDMGRVIGKTYCVETNESDIVFMARRYGRQGETPTVIKKEPNDSTNLVVILNKKEDYYSLVTTYIGELAPMEPWDSELLATENEEKIREAQEFWSTHALIYDRTAIDYILSTDGERISKEEFEKNVIYNKRRGLVLVMGPSGSGKTTFSREIAKAEDAVLFSSDVIREEIFAKELKDGCEEEVYTEDAKKRVYQEMISRVKESLKQGNLTIADATFLFESGEDARKQLCSITHANKIPTLVYIKSKSLEECLNFNSRKVEPISEEAVKDIWEYMNQNYARIQEELQQMSHVKVQVLGASKTVSVGYGSAGYGSVGKGCVGGYGSAGDGSVGSSAR